MNNYRTIILVLIAALIVAAYCWTRPGTSLCWIAEAKTIQQIQFSPYYWHYNRILYSEKEALNIIPSPDNPEQSTLELVTPRMNLIYAFADSSWIDDLDAFHMEINAVFQQQRRYSCRIRAATGWFMVASLVIVSGLFLLLISAFRRMHR